MTVFEYAIYSYATRLMTPDERDQAFWLARRGDAGDQEAAAAVRRMALDTIAERGKMKIGAEAASNGRRR